MIKLTEQGADMSRVLTLAIRAYQLWAPAYVKGNCPGPSLGQEHCSEYGLRLARTLPARQALKLTAVRLREHTDGPHMPRWYQWATRRRLVALVALIAASAAGLGETSTTKGNGPSVMPRTAVRVTSTIEGR